MINIKSFLLLLYPVRGLQKLVYGVFPLAPACSIEKVTLWSTAFRASFSIVGTHLFNVEIQNRREMRKTKLLRELGIESTLPGPIYHTPNHNSPDGLSSRLENCENLPAVSVTNATRQRKNMIVSFASILCYPSPMSNSVSCDHLLYGQ